MGRAFIVCLGTFLCLAPFALSSGESKWDRLRNEAEEYYHERRLAEAEKAWADALIIARSEVANESRVALSLTNLGVIRLEQGRLAPSGEALTEAVDIYGRCGSACSVALGVTLRNLGMVYQQEGRFVQAERCFRRALAVFERALPAEEEHILVLDNLASLDMHRDQLRSAQLWYEQAIALSNGAGVARPDRQAELYLGLANVLLRARKYDKAEHACQRSLHILSGIREHPHPELAKAHTTLGAIAVAQRRHADAEHHFLNARRLLDNANGKESLELGHVLYDLSVLYVVQKRFTEAEVLLREAFRIYNKHLSRQHPEQLHIRMAHARVLRKLGRKDQAREIEAEVHELRERWDAADGGGHLVDYRMLK